MYRLDYSDDDDGSGANLPPSTPDPPRRSARFASPNLSTTPAGPPPSSFTGQSTTPAGPPPLASSLFGSAKIPAPVFSRNVPSSPPPQVQSAAIREDADYDFDDAMDEDDPLEDVFVTHPAPPASRRSFRTRSGADLSRIAKSLALPEAPLREHDDLILRTESIVDELWFATSGDELDPLERDTLTSEAVQHLVPLWFPPASHKHDDQTIGPGAKAPATTKAGFVASLLLPLHHQPIRLGRASSSSKRPIPEILIEWLETHHWPYREDLGEVRYFNPNCAAHERFWDVVYNATLHCDLASVVEFLRAADWAQAATSLDDGAEDFGYQGRQLTNTQRVVKRCIQLLESSPALQHGDFDIGNADWSIFRKRVEQAMTDLEMFAEGASADRFAPEDPRASRNGRSSAFDQDLSFSQQSRRAESQVPWSIYQNLKYLYGQLLGTPSELAAAASDWVEASLAYTIWWNGEDSDMDGEDLSRSSVGGRRLLTRSASQRLIDVSPHEAYLGKLAASVHHFLGEAKGTDEEELQVDMTDPVSVALACALSGDMDGLLSLMNGWSVVIGTAVTEIADLGGWLGMPSADLMQPFDQSDLMVLSYGGQQQPRNKRDAVLTHYSDVVGAKDHFASSDGRTRRAGWQMAMEVLGRLHDRSGSVQRMSSLLDRMEMVDVVTVQDAIKSCRRLGLVEEASRISIRYADTLATTTSQFGEAIFYYVRGQAPRKIQELLDLLTTLSVVQSASYPPAKNIDPSLLDFVISPKQTVSRLRQLDPETADALMAHVSGYATVRKFYDTRDESRQRSMSPLERRKQTAATLVALIQSASDGIHGGLYDDTVASAVPVDLLLVLLGETLALLGQEDGVFTTPQLFAVLKAAEDLSSVSSSIRARCEDCLGAALGAYHGSPPPSPRTTLKKSTSALSASTAFSLVGSDMLRSRASAADSDRASGVLVPRNFPPRAWDWRAGLDRTARGDDVLRILRLQIARALAAAWTGLP